MERCPERDGPGAATLAEEPDPRPQADQRRACIDCGMKRKNMYFPYSQSSDLIRAVGNGEVKERFRDYPHLSNLTYICRNITICPDYSITVCRRCVRQNYAEIAFTDLPYPNSLLCTFPHVARLRGNRIALAMYQRTVDRLTLSTRVQDYLRAVREEKEERDTLHITNPQLCHRRLLDARRARVCYHRRQRRFRLESFIKKEGGNPDNFRGFNFWNTWVADGIADYETGYATAVDTIQLFNKRWATLMARFDLVGLHTKHVPCITHDQHWMLSTVPVDHEDYFVRMESACGGYVDINPSYFWNMTGSSICEVFDDRRAWGQCTFFSSAPTFLSITSWTTWRHYEMSTEEYRSRIIEFLVNFDVAIPYLHENVLLSIVAEAFFYREDT